MRGCTVEGCDRTHYALGYCNMHWTRRRKHGDPLVGERCRPHPCSIDGCARRAESRGWCNAHYKRWKRNGTPTPVPPSVEARFFDRVGEGPGGCWDWHTDTTHGYGGSFSPARGLTFVPHRWAYAFMVAEIPGDLELDHLCGNRRCVNPWHLEPVTHQVNLQRAAQSRVPSRTEHRVTEGTYLNA